MRIRQKIQRQVDIGDVDRNIWSAIPVDPKLQKELRSLDFAQIDDLGVLRWLLEKGSLFRCSFGWYSITRRGLEYMANRANAPIELIALTSAIFSVRTAVDLNILATNLWDIQPDNIWVYNRFRPDLPKGNIEKFLKMRQNWERLVVKFPSANTSDLAKVWTFALTRPNWEEIVQDELGSLSWLTTDAVDTINKLAKPITMYGKTGNYALNLLGYTGLITVDTHMFKPIFGTNNISEKLTTLLHRDKELYQSFSEDYTDLLEDLWTDMGISHRLGFEPSPAGLQAAVWVMRQAAGQDFTKPVNFHRFHRFRDALASDHLKPRKKTKTGWSKSKLEHIIDQLKDMYNNPTGTRGFTEDEIERWKAALQTEWITPLERFKEALDKRSIPYLPHPTKIREPKRIFSILEDLGQGTVSAEQMIEEIHRAKTKETVLLGEIQPILEAELPKIAEQLGFEPNHIRRLIRGVASGSAKAQEAVHISPQSSRFRNRQIEIAGKRYERSIPAILSLLMEAQNQNLRISPELFLGFFSGKTPTATLHPFWKRMFPKGRLEIAQNGGVDVVLPLDKQHIIRIQLNTTATPQDNRWFMSFADTNYRIVI